MTWGFLAPGLRRAMLKVVGSWQKDCTMPGCCWCSVFSFFLPQTVCPHWLPRILAKGPLAGVILFLFDCVSFGGDWDSIFWGFCECLVDTSISWYIYICLLFIVVNTVSVLFMVCKWFVVSKMIVYTYHMAMKWWVSCIQHGRVWKWRENRPMVIKE